MKSLYITIFTLVGVMAYAQESKKKELSKVEVITTGNQTIKQEQEKQEIPKLAQQSKKNNTQPVHSEGLISEQGITKNVEKNTALLRNIKAVKTSNKLVSEQ